MNQNIEDAIRKALEARGIVPPPEAPQEATQAPQAAQEAPQAPVSVEAALSQAIGGPFGHVALNDDNSLAKIIGANTLNGKKL